jgi:hypothetical protein
MIKAKKIPSTLHFSPVAQRTPPHIPLMGGMHEIRMGLSGFKKARQQGYSEIGSDEPSEAGVAAGSCRRT